MSNAEPIDVKEYEVYILSNILGDIYEYIGSTTIYPNNNEIEYDGEIETIVDNWGTGLLTTIYQITPIDNSVLIPRDREARVRFDNVYHSAYYDFRGVYLDTPTNVRVFIKYTDGTTEYLDDIVYRQSHGEPLLDVSFTFTPKFDVSYIEYQVVIEEWFDAPTKVISYLGERDGDSGFILEIDQQTEEAGLLSGLIEWVKGIFNKIGDIFESIKELPSKIWEFISEGLKSLFVPSDEFITEFKDNMNGMLSIKLGAVYQVVDITLNSWDRINESDETNMIDFPEVTIPLPDGEEFTFGGQTVSIVPEGFEFLVTSLKTIIGIICTVLFVNGLKRRYDEIMGG